MLGKDISQRHGNPFSWRKSINKAFDKTTVRKEHQDLHNWLDFDIEYNIPLRSIEETKSRKFIKIQHKIHIK